MVPEDKNKSEIINTVIHQSMASPGSWYTCLPDRKIFYIQIWSKPYIII